MKQKNHATCYTGSILQNFTHWRTARDTVHKDLGKSRHLCLNLPPNKYFYSANILAALWHTVHCPSGSKISNNLAKHTAHQTLSAKDSRLGSESQRMHSAVGMTTINWWQYSSKECAEATQWNIICTFQCTTQHSIKYLLCRSLHWQCVCYCYHGDNCLRTGGSTWATVCEIMEGPQQSKP